MLDADLLHLATLTLATMKLRGETKLGVWQHGDGSASPLDSPTRLALYWAEFPDDLPDSYTKACRLVGWPPKVPGRQP